MAGACSSSGAASSSSAPAPTDLLTAACDADDIASDAALCLPGTASADKRLVPIPHTDLVLLDDRVLAGGASSGSRVLHTWTLETVSLLDGGAWILVFSDDGYGACVDVSDTHPTVLLEDAFKRTVYRTPSGEIIYRESLPTKKRRRVLLGENYRQFEECKVSIPVGAMFKPHDHTLYIMTTPRQSMRCYWSCVQLYDAMLMTTYGGKRSKWLT